MNKRPLYLFLAGIFLGFIGLSLHGGGMNMPENAPQSAQDAQVARSLVGLVMEVLAGLLIVAGLFLQFRQARK